MIDRKCFYHESRAAILVPCSNFGTDGPNTGISFSYDGLAPGRHNLAARSSDIAGNVADVISWIFSVDSCASANSCIPSTPHMGPVRDCENGYLAWWMTTSAGSASRCSGVPPAPTAPTASARSARSSRSGPGSDVGLPQDPMAAAVAAAAAAATRRVMVGLRTHTGTHPRYYFKTLPPFPLTRSFMNWTSRPLSKPHTQGLNNNSRG